MGHKNKNKSMTSHGTVALNRKARFNYQINHTLEAGIVLTGSEVKALRLGKANISDAYITTKDNSLVIVNLHIGKYNNAPSKFQHQEKRIRNLLVHRTQKNKLQAASSKESATIIPLSIYFNSKGIAKLDIAIAKGKKLYDKRNDIKKRDWQRSKAKILKERL